MSDTTAQGFNPQNQPIRERLDYSQTLFKQMLQIATELHNPKMFENNVNLLETILTPYLDDDYYTEIGNIDERIREVRKSEQYKYQEIYFNDNMLQKYKALMKLARRKGLLPQEIIGHVMGED